MLEFLFGAEDATVPLFRKYLPRGELDIIGVQKKEEPYPGPLQGAENCPETEIVRRQIFTRKTKGSYIFEEGFLRSYILLR